MGCTGGWDWAPVSPTEDHRHDPTFTKGIWKSVYLSRLPANAVAIHHLSPQVHYNGPHAMARLKSGRGTNTRFTVATQLELWSATVQTAEVTLKGDWQGAGNHAVRSVRLAAQTTTVVSFNLTAVGPELWWPLGMGNQTMHTLTASVVAAVPPPPASVQLPATTTTATTARAFGFRSVALVTSNEAAGAVREAAEANEEGPAGHGSAPPGPTRPTNNNTNDTNDNNDNDEDGNGMFTMFFRVNGVAIYARGANVVPMEELDGRVTAAAHTRMVRSAAEAGFNMLRIWSGGIYQYRAFYEAADAYGVLLYHDLMFAFRAHTPCCPYYPCQQASQNASSGGTCSAHCDCEGATADDQRKEIAHNTRRLMPHPSIVLWDAANEVGGFGHYADFVMTSLVKDDTSRRVNHTF